MQVEELLASARAWIFDFDGTLVDSNAIKARAFDHCFEGLTRGREEALAYCYANPHSTRSEKFRHVYEKILRVPYAPEMERDMHRRFEDATTQQIIEAPVIPGAEEFLVKGRVGRLCGLLSSTPQEILARILECRRWDRLFDVVRGAPVKKGLWLVAFQIERGLKPEQVIYFGDQPEDADSASAAGCGFVGLRNPLLRGRGMVTWEDFTDAAQRIS